MQSINRFEAAFARDGHYFIDFNDLECLRFHYKRISQEIENGDYDQEFQYQFAKAELLELKEAIHKFIQEVTDVYDTR